MRLGTFIFLEDREFWEEWERECAGNYFPALKVFGHKLQLDLVSTSWKILIHKYYLYGLW